jgi:hypothetical protein
MDKGKKLPCAQAIFHFLPRSYKNYGQRIVNRLRL